MLLALLVVGQAVAQPRPPARPDAADQASASETVVRAHQALETAVVEVGYGAYFSYPDETEFFATDYKVWFDRKGNRLRVERPGYTLVSDGTDLLLVADDLPGRHLRAPLNGPLRFERLLEVFPDLVDPMPPALILLLADPPMAWLSAGFTESATVLRPKDRPDNDRLHLNLPGQFGGSRLSFDRRTRLLDEMLSVVDDKQLQGAPVDAMRFHYAVDWQSVDEPIDAKQFTLDLEGSQESTTLAQFMAAPGPGPGNNQAAGNNPGGGGGGGGSLIGQALPDTELKRLDPEDPEQDTVKLSDLDEGLVVLEFFASWTRPSTLDLPALVDYQAWCEDNDYDVMIYGVAVGEKSKAIRKWIEALEKTAGKEIDLPILLDSKTDAAMALRLPTVPRTLIVVDGKIVEVYGGTKPEFLEDLTKETPGWLEKVEPADDRDAVEAGGE